MSHSDPLLAIPFGLAFGLLAAWVALDPERVAGQHGWPRTLERRLGHRAAMWVLRVCCAVTAIVCLGLAVHASRSTLGV